MKNQSWYRLKIMTPKKGKKMKQEKAVEPKKKQELAAPTNLQGPEEILATDVTIPRLMLMQGLSELVTARKAQLGDMVRSTSAEKLGDPEEGVDFIPLTFRNKWLIQELVPGNQKPLFVRFEPRNAKNEHWPWDYKEGERVFKRVKVLEVFVLLPRDVVKSQEAKVEFDKTGIIPDLDVTLLPVVLTFRGMSYKAGTAVTTQFMRARGLAAELGVVVKPHGNTMNLTSKHTKNEKGEFYIFEVAAGPKAEPKHVEAADKWCQLLQQSSDVTVDDYEEDAPGQAAPLKGDDQF